MKETIELVSNVNHLLRCLNERFLFFQEVYSMTEDSDLQKAAVDNCLQTKKFQKILEIYSDETPEEAGTSLWGDSKRLWFKLKSSISGNDLDSLIESSIDMEKHTLQEYKDVLEYQLPHDLQDIIKTQFLQIEETHKALITRKSLQY